MVELFLLLRDLHKSGLKTLIAPLIRRQCFDELGLTHTCCLVKEGNSFEILSRHYEDRNQEFEPIYNHSLATDDSESVIDLHEEQAELIDELEKYCKGLFETRLRTWQNPSPFS